MVKIGQCALSGYVKGLWDKDSKSFVIKRGKTKNDKRYQTFEIGVSKKDKDGKWTNGQGIRVTLYGDTKVEEKQKIGVIGSFEPNNYEKDGKTVFGNSFVAFELFEPLEWKSENQEKSTSNKAKEEEDGNPWLD